MSLPPEIPAIASVFIGPADNALTLMFEGLDQQLNILHWTQEQL